MYKLLIVEDDATIANALKEYFTSWGMETQCVSDFQNVLSEFALFSPHIVLLDITLPFFNGFHWCQEIRKLSKVPIIFISSASDNMNIIMAITMGGDDFISKPFDLAVLATKVQGLLRRAYDFSGSVDFLEHKGVILNLADATVTYQGQKLDLTKNEYRILQVLLSNKGRVVSREFLMQKLWESDSFVDENTLSVNITRLRRKLEHVGVTNYITTKKGIGYLVE
jgi:two-component system response regulator protein BraR/BceR